MKMTMDEFIDLCIMLGCDYTSPIKGIGPNPTYKLVEKNRTVENCLRSLRGTNDGHKRTGRNPPYKIPDDENF